MSLNVVALGQAGVRLAFADTVLYIDPYLTDSVAATYGPSLTRQLPPPMRPQQVDDASWVLVTHAHLDHADPETLGPLAAASPAARFIVPPPVVPLLREAGITAARISTAVEEWQPVSPTVDVRAVPAAHLEPERTADGFSCCVGFLLRCEGRVVYHAGDTVPHPEVLAAVREAGAPDFALLPVNERNYYRDAQGIVGNMSVREALQMADDIRASTTIPIHWDLFAPNSTPKAEIELVYQLMQPNTTLRFCESGRPERLW